MSGGKPVETKRALSVNYFLDSAFLNPNFNALPNYCGPMFKRALRNRCATNADCRLADWPVNEVNIVLKCSNRFPIPKTRLRDGDGESTDLLEHFSSLFTSLPYTRQSASCRTPLRNLVLLRSNFRIPGHLEWY